METTNGETGAVGGAEESIIAISVSVRCNTALVMRTVRASEFLGLQWACFLKLSL